MNFSIGQYIYAKLNAITALKDKVFPVVALFESEDNTVTPFAVYYRDSYQPDYTKDMYAETATHTYGVRIYDDDYTNTLTLAKSVCDAMMELSYEVKSDIRFGQVRLTGLSESFIDGLYSQELTFEIQTEEI